MFCFIISGNIIPSLTETTVNSFGKLLNCGLKDKDDINKIISDVDILFSGFDVRIAGLFMVWINQHAILHRFLWPVFLYGG